MCICIQTFPDLTILKEESGLGTVALMNWFQTKFLRDHMAGWVTIHTEEEGRQRKAAGRSNWVLKPTVTAMVDQLAPPSRQELYPLLEPVEWPAITSGGAVSMHQACQEGILRLPAFHKIDSAVFVKPHPNKIILWQWGIAPEQLAMPHIHPVPGATNLGLIAGPGLVPRLPLDPMTWTRLTFQEIGHAAWRSERMLVHKFMRVYPDQALAVHLHSVQNHEAFRTLVHFNHTVKLILDIRKMLRQLNIPFETPDPDPYVMEVAVLKKSMKGNQHILRMQQEVVRQQQVADMQISVVNTSLELVKNPSAQPGLSKEEVTYRAIATMQLEFSWIPSSKKKR